MSVNSSLHPQPENCLFLRPVFSIYAAELTTNILILLPIFVYVLYLGYQRRRKQRSVSTAAMTSHSDIFTFHMVAMEIIGVLGSFFYSCGTYTNQVIVITAGEYMLSIILYGQTLFHLLTCVERYLAVVHPVTYLGLRQAGGVRIRNISIGCVWLISCGSLPLSVLIDNFPIIFTLLLLVFSSIVVSFCSLSVLCALIRPGPGEVGGNRERVDQSKQRAFYTIVAIMGALLLRFLSNLVSIVIYSSSVLSSSDFCVLGASVDWFSLPCSLVLPLLFLHRAGKLPDCKRNTVSA